MADVDVGLDRIWKKEERKKDKLVCVKSIHRPVYQLQIELRPLPSSYRLVYT